MNSRAAGVWMARRHERSAEEKERSRIRRMAAKISAAAKRKSRKEFLIDKKVWMASRHERAAAEKKRAWNRRMVAKRAAAARHQKRPWVRNVSSIYGWKKRSFRRVVSFPRSGRHWITMILHGLGHEKEITFTHDRSTYGSVLYESNKRPYGDRSVALLARDPRDVSVSMWHFYKYRTTEDDFQRLSLWDYTKGPYGISYAIRFLNDWANPSNRDERTKFYIFRYEDMMTDLVSTLERLLTFFSYKFGSLEWAKAITPDVVQYRPDSVLPDDRRARHCRRAEAGAWRDYYTADQCDWLTEKLRELNPVYGYE